MKPILFPDIRFYTNDSRAIVRGVAGAKGFAISLAPHAFQAFRIVRE